MNVRLAQMARPRNGKLTVQSNGCDRLCSEHELTHSRRPLKKEAVHVATASTHAVRESSVLSAVCHHTLWKTDLSLHRADEMFHCTLKPMLQFPSQKKAETQYALLSACDIHTEYLRNIYVEPTTRLRSPYGELRSRITCPEGKRLC